MSAASRIVASNRASRQSSEWLDSRKCSKTDFTQLAVCHLLIELVERHGFNERSIHPDPYVLYDKKMYSFENSPQSLLRAANWSFCFDCVLTGGRLKVHCISLSFAEGSWSGITVRTGIYPWFRCWTAALVISME